MPRDDTDYFADYVPICRRIADVTPEGREHLLGFPDGWSAGACRAMWPEDPDKPAVGIEFLRQRCRWARKNTPRSHCTPSGIPRQVIDDED